MIQHIKDQKTLSVPKKIIPDNFYGRFKGTLPLENLSVEFIGHIKNRSLNIGSGTDCEVVSYTIRKNGKPVCNYRGFLDNNHIPDRFGQFTIYKDGRIHTKYTGCIANGIPSKDCVIKFSSGYVVGGRINEDGYLSGEGFYANQNDKFYHKGLWCDGKFSATHYKNIHIYFDIFCSFFWKSFLKKPVRVAFHFRWVIFGAPIPMIRAVWSLCFITVIFFDTIIGYLKYTSRMKKELDNIKIEQIVFPYTNPIEIV
jgi:hypothetical protein